MVFFSPFLSTCDVDDDELQVERGEARIFYSSVIGRRPLLLLLCLCLYVPEHTDEDEDEMR